MPKVEFVGQSARDASAAQAQSSRLINLYREPISTSGIAGFMLRSVPGMSAFTTLGGVMMRALYPSGGVLYAVCGGQLWSVSSGGAAAKIGAVQDGPASIAANAGVLTVASGGRYYTVTDGAMTEFDLSDYWPAGSLDYLGGYTLIAERGGRRFMWSELADGTTLPALNYATAEQREDKIVRGLSINDVFWIFKERSIEQWQITGAAGADAFQRIPGAVLEVGLMGHDLIARYQNGAAFIGHDGVFYLAGSGQLQPMSTPAVATAILTCGPKALLYYEARGHKFVAIAFRSCPAWVFDLTTGEWHERAEGTRLAPWSATASAWFGGAWVIGYDNGALGKADAVAMDFGGHMVRQATSRTIHNGERFRVPRLEFLVNVGAANTTNPGGYLGGAGGYLTQGAGGLWSGGAAREPQMMLRVSDDGVRFYGEQMAGLGRAGEYGTTVIFRALGQFYRRFAAEIRITDPVDVPIFSEAVVDIA